MAKENVPKLLCSAGSVDETIGLLNYFVSGSWQRTFLSHYPDLRKPYQAARSLKQRHIAVYSYFKRHENKAVLDKKAQDFSVAWEPLNDRVMQALSTVVEMPWPNTFDEISVRVAMNPICPRFLSSHSFDLFYRQSRDEMITTALHELLHFIYFEKWKAVFPRAQKSHFESPNIVWRLSEMVPYAVLRDSKIQTIYRHAPPVYPEFYGMKIGHKDVLSHLSKLFEERKDFAGFLRSAYRFIQRGKEELERKR